MRHLPSASRTLRQVSYLDLPYLADQKAKKGNDMGNKRSSTWESLKPELMARMQSRLGQDFDDFAMTCEQTGLLTNNFVKLSRTIESDIDFACAMCASAVVSAANQYGGQGEIPLAERLAHWALKLEPHHVPALICLATIYQVAGNTSKEAEMRRRASTIIDRLSAMPESQLSSFEQGILSSVH